MARTDFVDHEYDRQLAEFKARRDRAKKSSKKQAQAK
jgi:hypothetical protein